MADKKLVALINGFHDGDRQALAKLITLVEKMETHFSDEVDELLKKIERASKPAMRVAISGPPGVGKSTFINVFAQKLLKRKFKIAILPIDPSSEVNSGSVLADKTRMKELLGESDVFIRPSPSKCSLGGVTLATKDVMFLCEAFGFDCVIIETTGVGQSETLAHVLTDHFILLMQPGSGDQLQAMKKGILEHADFLVVTKSDGEQKSLADATLKTLRGIESDDDNIFSVSSYDDVGIDAVIEKLCARHERMEATKELDIRRREQWAEFFVVAFKQMIAKKILETPRIQQACQRIIDASASRDGMVLPDAVSLVTKLVKDL